MPLTPEEQEAERLRLLAEGTTISEPGSEPLPGTTEPATTTVTAPAVQPQPTTGPLTAAAPTGFVAPASYVPPPPPPPEPPPPSPDLQGIAGDVGAFARQWLETPNRYLSDLVTSTREEGGLRRTKAQEDAALRIEEWAAGRGLIGSSYEGEQVVDLEGEMERARAEDERRLLEMIATAESIDRQAAGRYGLDVAQYGETAGLPRYEAELEAARLAETQRQFGGSTELTREQMEHQIRMQTSEITQRESEFARSIGLNEREFTAEQDRFAQQFGEQVATRLQQDEQFTTALASDEGRFALDIGLREKALALQETGMEMDEAFRRASLEQEEELRTRALDLTQQGMDQEDAYRWSALEQDGEFRQRTLDLQELGLTLEDAYRQSELEFRQKQLDQQESEFARELQFRLDQATTEQERFEAMMELWNKYFGNDGSSPDVAGTGYTPEDFGVDGEE